MISDAEGETATSKIIRSTNGTKRPVKRMSKSVITLESSETTLTSDIDNGDVPYIKIFRDGNDEISVLSFGAEVSDEESSLASSANLSVLHNVLGSSIELTKINSDDADKSTRILDDDDNFSVASSTSSIRSMLSASSKSLMSLLGKVRTREKTRAEMEVMKHN